MADFDKVKKKKTNRFGKAPTVEDASNNLDQPEHAPAAPPTKKKAAKKKPVKKKVAKPKTTERTVAFGQKVSPEFMKDFKQTALEHDLKLVELLEASLEAFKNLHKS